MFKPVSMLAFALAASTAYASPIVVNSTADSGDGSLRAALAQASQANIAQEIIITHKDDIALASGLSYTGRAPLVITGHAQTLSLSANATLFSVTEGADLTLNSLRLQGPAGFSIEKRGDVNGQTAGKGLFVDVRDDQTGTVHLELNDVVVTGFANHGVHLSDCSLADDCGGGSGGAGEGSPASIAVTLNNVEINNVGQGRFDADGLRVDERAAGDIRFTAVNSSFTYVGADGVELDEGQAGDVIVSVDNSAFNKNGAYCDPTLLKPYMPKVDEAEYEDGQAKESDVPAKISGTADDRCFEREVKLYKSGSVKSYEFAIDLDDGFDIDEAGDGDLRAVVRNSVIRDNLDEGLDFDEEGAGSILLTIVNTEATGNTDDGFKNSEADAGDVRATMIGSLAQANGGKGAVFEEENDGDVAVVVLNSQTAKNDDSDKTGLEVVQEDAGTGVATVINSDIADGIDAEGVAVK